MTKIKEEIITDTLLLMYKTGVTSEEICIVDKSASVMWNLNLYCKYVTMYVSPKAYDDLADSEWLNALAYSPVLPGEVYPTPGMIGHGRYTLYMHPSFNKLDKVLMDDIPVCSLDSTLKGLDRLKIYCPNLEKIKMVVGSFEDITPAELEFVRKLESFDKYYQYSDDSLVYHAGKKREAELVAIMEANPRAGRISGLLNQFFKSV